VGPWILGESFSLADVSWLVIFQRLVQVDSLHLFTGEGRRPQCTEYW
jgi:glutathione S-transferase